MNGAPGTRTRGSWRDVAAVGEVPVDEERCRHDVPEESEARQDRAERPPLRRDVDELDLEQIARPRALHEHRPGQRMDRAGGQGGEVCFGRLRPEVAVGGVARLERDLLALVDLDDRRHVGMPAVVTGLRLVLER